MAMDNPTRRWKHKQVVPSEHIMDIAVFRSRLDAESSLNRQQWLFMEGMQGSPALAVDLRAWSLTQTLNSNQDLRTLTQVNESY